MTVATFGTKKKMLTMSIVMESMRWFQIPAKDKSSSQAPSLVPSGEIEAGEDAFLNSSANWSKKLSFLGDIMAKLTSASILSHRDTHYYNPALYLWSNDFVEAQKPLEFQ